MIMNKKTTQIQLKLKLSSKWIQIETISMSLLSLSPHFFLWIFFFSFCGNSFCNAFAKCSNLIAHTYQNQSD